MRFSQKGFTLIELLVVITIIGIMTIGALNMRFDVSNSEKLNMFNTEIMNPIEAARNSSLIGKGVLSGTNLVIPENWRNIISPSDGVNFLGSIETLYTINSVEIPYSTYNTQKPFIIEKVECKLLDDTINEISPTDTVDILFEGSKITTDSTNSGCKENVKEIIITTNILDKVRGQVTINKLSGVVQSEKLLDY